MAELLVEVLTEDMPPHMQRRAEFEDLFGCFLREARLPLTSLRVFTTPRRLTWVVEGLAACQEAQTQVRRGPRVDAPPQAIQGFLTSVGLSSVEECLVKATAKGSFLWAETHVPQRPCALVLSERLPAFLMSVPWPQSLRFAGSSFRWGRPIRGLVVCLDGALVPVSLDLGSWVLKARLQTPGHRAMSPDLMPVTSFRDYKEKLHQAGVVLEQEERESLIASKVKEQTKEVRMVAALVESPHVFQGHFDPSFMDLPSSLITTCMWVHQKFFPCRDPQGNLLPQFIFVADVKPRSEVALRVGHERVLRARLEDARFFWEQDKAVGLESYRHELDSVVYHDKLGTLKQRVSRLEVLACHVAPSLDSGDVERAVRLCKADLVSLTVREFPSLQGVIGGALARLEGEKETVAHAVATHYDPQTPLAVALFLADQVEMVAGFWSIGQRPTGAGDPYGVRRAVLGVFRVMEATGGEVALRDVFAFALSLFHAEEVLESLSAFVFERLAIHLKERWPYDVVRAVLGTEEDRLGRLLERMSALSSFIERPEGARLLVSFRRAHSLLAKEQERETITFQGDDVDPGCFIQQEEVNVLDRVESVRESLKTCSSSADALACLGQLSSPLMDFFVAVRVNDSAHRNNRLSLLARVCDTFSLFADFHCIEGRT